MNLKLLIIDDNADIRKLLKRRLKRHPYEISTAENGKEGIEIALEIMPDLILMDMHMPEMDGYEATKTLRQKGYLGLIIALTASAMVEDKNKCIVAGCDQFISKPIDRDFEGKLVNIIKEHRQR